MTGGAVVSEGTIRDALDMGYRCLDSATAYRNEDLIGDILRDTGYIRAAHTHTISRSKGGTSEGDMSSQRRVCAKVIS